VLPRRGRGQKLGQGVRALLVVGVEEGRGGTATRDAPARQARAPVLAVDDETPAPVRSVEEEHLRDDARLVVVRDAAAAAGDSELESLKRREAEATDQRLVAVVVLKRQPVNLRRPGLSEQAREG